LVELTKYFGALEIRFRLEQNVKTDQENHFHKNDDGENFFVFQLPDFHF
jgi:hypothetical protein